MIEKLKKYLSVNLFSLSGLILLIITFICLIPIIIVRESPQWLLFIIIPSSFFCIIGFLIIFCAEIFIKFFVNLIFKKQFELNFNNSIYIKAFKIGLTLQVIPLLMLILFLFH